MGTDKIICDTDVLIDYFEKNKLRHLQIKEIIENKIGIDNVILSIISKMELFSGAFNKKELSLLSKYLRGLNVLAINQGISSIASDLVEKYTLSHGLTIPDAIVAATAIYTDKELFTYNHKDFKFINEVRLYKL